METAKHTSTPWYCDQLPDESGGYGVWQDADPCDDMTICVLGGTEVRRKANAEYVAQACNNFEKLVEALSRLLAYADGHNGDYDATTYAEQALREAGIEV